MPQANNKTTIVNTSGERRYFDFLPPIGGYLNADQEFSAPGSLYDWLRRKGAGPIREKIMRSLDYALDQGWIEIKSEPGIILYDATNEESKELKLDDGTLSVVAPAYVTPTTTTATPTTTTAP